jgi:hypothetical protein
MTLELFRGFVKIINLTHNHKENDKINDKIRKNVPARNSSDNESVSITQKAICFVIKPIMWPYRKLLAETKLSG